MVRDFELYMNTAEQVLIAENEQAVAEGKRRSKSPKAGLLLKLFKLFRKKDCGKEINLNATKTAVRWFVFQSTGWHTKRKIIIGLTFIGKIKRSVGK